MFFGIAVFVQDAINQEYYSTSVGDVLSTLGVPFYYQQKMINLSDLLKVFLNMRFAYAAVLAGMMASIGSAICNSYGKRAAG